MKITKTDYATLQAVIAPFDTPERRAQYKANGISAKRYRWDITYAAGLTPFICDVLYKYLNDDNIDTALRNIVAFE